MFTEEINWLFLRSSTLRGKAIKRYFSQELRSHGVRLVTFHNFGFDKVVGSAAISEQFPSAELSPWGIGDKWMFKYAEKILEDAEKTNNLFLL